MSIFRVALVVLVLLLGYLLLLPVSIAPVAWTPTPVASLPPPTSLRAIQRIEPVLPDFVGPEGIAADTEGRIYAGLGDGRLLRLSADFGSCTLLDNSGGRPLGLAVSSDGALLIADARSGLLSLGRDGQLRTLSDRADGVAYGFTDDVTVTAELTSATLVAVLPDALPMVMPDLVVVVAGSVMMAATTVEPTPAVPAVVYAPTISKTRDLVSDVFQMTHWAAVVGMACTGAMPVSAADWPT